MPSVTLIFERGTTKLHHHKPVLVVCCTCPYSTLHTPQPHTYQSRIHQSSAPSIPTVSIYAHLAEPIAESHALVRPSSNTSPHCTQVCCQPCSAGQGGCWAGQVAHVHNKVTGVFCAVCALGALWVHAHTHTKPMLPLWLPCNAQCVILYKVQKAETLSICCQGGGSSELQGNVGTSNGTLRASSWEQW
eukprot:1151035-Pelagomonas_calceolata.AAC.1